MQETTQSLTETRHEVGREFEKASLAMMRAFESVQRYRSQFEDAGAEVPESGRLLNGYHDVGATLHYVLRCIAINTTGNVAVAVAAALDRTDIERVVSDGKLRPPRRRAIIQGLTGLIDERTRQIEGLVDRHVENDPELSIETAFTGITAAFRQVHRERDVLIHARDIV